MGDQHLWSSLAEVETGLDAQGGFPAAGLLALSGSRAARSPGLRRLGRSLLAKWDG